ncbi:MAG: hypothetical protein HY038_06610 [Nitrospirae bacterium]|nr:hypothetical protein [Nitrospirota bacterium]
MLAESAWAETWVCPRPGQSDLYTDRGGLGCRQLGEAKTYSPLEISPGPKSQESVIVPPTVSSTVPPGLPFLQHKKPLPFPEVSLALPILGIGQTRVGSISGSWNGLVARLTVGYRADGMGPEILLPDSNLSPVSVRSFLTAVSAATRAVGYDPRYLTVRLLVPTSMDGPSAGGIFAVGIASALLGDPIRQDICMSGTIEPTLEIKPVGRLVDKMNACRDLRKTTMIVPDGLDNSHLNFTGAEKTIHVVEVHTLAEAYSAATGQALRQVAFQ